MAIALDIQRSAVVLSLPLFWEVSHTEINTSQNHIFIAGGCLIINYFFAISGSCKLPEMARDVIQPLRLYAYGGLRIGCGRGFILSYVLDGSG